MASLDRAGERNFVDELLKASRAGRISWTGTAMAECYQLAIGGFILMIRPIEGDAPGIALHNRNGSLVEVIRAAGEDEAVPRAVMAEIYDLARSQALGLRRTWKALARQLAAAPAVPAAIDD